MSQRPRHVTLRHHRDAPPVHNAQQNFRKTPVRAAKPVVSEPMARFPRWPKNIFFASDFIADRTSTAATAAAAAAATAAGATRTVMYSAKPRHMVREALNRGGTAPQPKDGVEDRITTRRCMLRAPSVASASSPERGRAAQRPGEKRGAWMAEEGFGLEGRAQPGSTGRSIRVHDSKSHKVAAAAAGKKKEALFLEESASALLFLHSRFFGELDAVQQEEELVCRLCMLCKEAGWMGDPRGVYSGLDPLVLDGLLAERLEAKKRTIKKMELQGLQRPDGHHRRPAAGVLVFSFEDFYQTLADVACLVYPHEASNGNGARSGRAMHRLLLEGVLPLADDSKPRVWSPSPEVLYGRPALTALRAQRGSLHQLYCSYSNSSRARNGATGFSRQTFLRMLRDLGASPGSVSEERAKAVFDAVLRNGLPETQALRDSKRHHVMNNAWMAGGTNGGSANLVDRCGAKERISRGGRLCWSLFLEAMAALAVEAVEDRHGTARQNDEHTAVNTNRSAVSSQSRQARHRDRDANGGDQYDRHLPKPGSAVDKEHSRPRRDRSHHSSRQMCGPSCRPSDANSGGDEEIRQVNGRQNGSEKRRHKAKGEQKLTASTSLDAAASHATAAQSSKSYRHKAKEEQKMSASAGLHATVGHATAGHATTGDHAAAGQSSKPDRHQLRHWRGSCQFDDTTRKMELMPTLPESNVLVHDEQAGMPVKHRFSPEHAVQREGFRGRPAMLASETATVYCSKPETATIIVSATDSAAAAPEPLDDDDDSATVSATAAPESPAGDKRAVFPKDGPQAQCVKRFADEARVEMSITHASDDQRQSSMVASPDRGLRLPLRAGSDEGVPFHDGGGGAAHATGQAYQERQANEPDAMSASMHQELETHTAVDELSTVGVPKNNIKALNFNASDEGLGSKSDHGRPIGRGKHTENPTSDQNKFETSDTTSQGREIKWEHLCAANGKEIQRETANGVGHGSLRANGDLETTVVRQQLRFVCSHARSSNLPSAAKRSPLLVAEGLASAGGLSSSIAEGRAQHVEDVLKTPAPCHGSTSTPSPSHAALASLASNAKPGFEGGKHMLKEVPGKPVTLQARETADTLATPAAIAGGRVQAICSLSGHKLCASGISYAGPDPSSRTPREAVLNCFQRCKGKRRLGGTALTEVITAAVDKSGSVIANESCKQAPPHHLRASTASTTSTASTAPTSPTEQAASTHIETGDASGELCRRCGSPIEGMQTERLREHPRSLGLVNHTGLRRKEINELEKHCGNLCAVGRKSGGLCDSSLRDDRATTTVGTVGTVGTDEAVASVGAAGCTTMIFEELLEPKVVAVYSRHREQLVTLFRRYSTGPNISTDRHITTPPCSQEPSGCVLDTGMRQFVNEFPSLEGWTRGEGILQLLAVVRASRDRGWRRLKEGGDTADMDVRRGTQGLCYLGFLEVLTRMAHAAKGNSPTHQKLLTVMRSLKADDPRRILS